MDIQNIAAKAYERVFLSLVEDFAGKTRAELGREKINVRKLISLRDRQLPYLRKQADYAYMGGNWRKTELLLQVLEQVYRDIAAEIVRREKLQGRIATRLPFASKVAEDIFKIRCFYAAREGIQVAPMAPTGSSPVDAATVPTETDEATRPKGAVGGVHTTFDLGKKSS